MSGAGKREGKESGGYEARVCCCLAEELKVEHALPGVRGQRKEGEFTFGGGRLESRRACKRLGAILRRRGLRLSLLG